MHDRCGSSASEAMFCRCTWNCRGVSIKSRNYLMQNRSTATMVESWREVALCSGRCVPETPVDWAQVVSSHVTIIILLMHHPFPPSQIQAPNSVISLPYCSSPSHKGLEASAKSIQALLHQGSSQSHMLTCLFPRDGR